MSEGNRRRSLSPLTIVKSYIDISHQNFRPIIPTRRALRPGESGFVDGMRIKQSWSQWVGEKFMRSGIGARTIEEITLFPGWASRHRAHGHEHENAFDLHVSVCGYASTRRQPEYLTRSQRAFLRVAKAYASLAKLPRQQSLTRGTTMIEIDGIKLPPRPDEIADDFEVELNKEFERMRQQETVQSSEEPRESGLQLPSPNYNTPLLQKQHDNLEARLRPFWSSVLSSRTIQICIYAKPHAQDRTHSKRDAHGYGPLLTEHVVTGPDGAFSKTFRISWSELSKHTLGRHQPFDKSRVEHELLINAKLLPTTSAHLTPGSNSKDISLIVPITSSPIRVITDVDDTIKRSDIASGARTVFRNVFVRDLEENQIPEMATWYKSMWERGVHFHYVSNSPFELLSVIREFLQISDLPPGSIRLKSYNGRSFFNGLLSDPATRKRANVIEALDGFPESKFILIGDSGEQDLELYASVASEYPNQILAVFIRDVHDTGLADPTGSLPSPPSPRNQRAQTKKMSLPLNATPGRPRVFRAMSGPELVASPGSDIGTEGRYISSVFTTPPQSFTSFNSSAAVSDSKPSARVSVESVNSVGSSSYSLSRNFRRMTGQTVISMTEAEKKRLELQTRVNKARLMMAPHIVLRVFNHPQECTEIGRLLESLNHDDRDKPHT